MTRTYDIVGCGSVVRQHHVPPLQLLRSRGEVKIAGCYDLNEEAARELAEILGAERSGPRGSPREGDGVDGVVVGTPPSAHAAIALDYVRAGKSAFVEKPFTARAAEAAELVRQAKAGPARVLVNHWRRYLPNANTARRFVQGRVDEVRAIEATDGSRWDWPTASDYVVEDAYGGALHALGSHLLDTVLYVLGLDGENEAIPADIGELQKTPAREPSHECSAAIVLERARGQRIPIRLSVSHLRPLAHGVKFWGSFGLLFLPYSFASPPVLLRDSSGLTLNSAGGRSESDDPRGCFLLAHRAFLRAVGGDPGASSRIDGGRFLLLGELLDSLHQGVPA